MSRVRVNGRAKGRAFEQAIARDMRNWLGAEWTVARNQTDRQKGQVAGYGAGEFTITGPKKFPFAVECKATEAFDESQLFRTPVVGPFPKWWQQAVAQARSVALRPMLIFKRNQGPVLLAIQWFPPVPLPVLSILLEKDHNVCITVWSEVSFNAALRTAWLPRALRSKAPPPLKG